MIEAPLGNALTALIAVEGNFQESGVAFRAFGSDLITENEAQEFQRLGLLANSEDVDSLCPGRATD
jgi:hypothetical protein